VRKKIISELNWGGDKYILEYCDSDNFDSLPYENCQQVYGVCFVKNKMVVVFGEGGKNGNGWGLVGGHVEKGESFEETLIREVQEETNMKVIKCTPVGVQKVISPNGKIYYQLRYFAFVEPIGKFEKDPAGSVSKIKMINPKEYKKYFDWGEIGDRIIGRAIELKNHDCGRDI